MRTSGPLRPSGRRLASTSSGGSALGVPSSARTCSATVTDHFTARDILDAAGRLADEHARRRRTRSPARAPPSRPIPITAMAAGASPSSGVLARITASSADCKHRHPHRRQRGAHLGDLEHAEQVGRGDAGQLPAAQRAGDRRWPAPGRGAGRPRRPAPVPPPSGSTSSSFGPAGAVAVLLDDPRAHASTAPARTPRCPAHASAAWPPRARRAAWPGTSVCIGHRLADPPVGQQPAVRVGGIRQPVQQPRQQHRLHPPAAAALVDQRGQVRQRALRTLVAQRGQLPLGGRRRQARRDLQPPGRRIPAAADRRAWRAAATPAGSAA